LSLLERSETENDLLLVVDSKGDACGLAARLRAEAVDRNEIDSVGHREQPSRFDVREEQLTRRGRFEYDRRGGRERGNESAEDLRVMRPEVMGPERAGIEALMRCEDARQTKTSCHVEAVEDA